jgi:spoIIIJ-associated protein
MHHKTITLPIIAMLGHFGYAEADVAVTHDEATDTLWFAITSPNTRLLFLRDAEALAALNHLATKISEQLMREASSRPRVVIDANSHEKKKIETLHTTAHMMAERARYFKSSISLDPMPPHERRIIHEFLAELPDLETESAGMGDKRHVVIKYKEPI